MIISRGVKRIHPVSFEPDGEIQTILSSDLLFKRPVKRSKTSQQAKHTPNFSILDPNDKRNKKRCVPDVVVIHALQWISYGEVNGTISRVNKSLCALIKTDKFYDCRQVLDCCPNTLDIILLFFHLGKCRKKLQSLVLGRGNKAFGGTKFFNRYFFINNIASCVGSTLQTLVIQDAANNLLYVPDTLPGDYKQFTYNFAQLKRLDLSQSSIPGYMYTLNFFQGCPKLQEIKLGIINYSTTLANLMRSCPCLESIDVRIHDTTNIIEEDLSMLKWINPLIVKRIAIDFECTNTFSNTSTRLIQECYATIFSALVTPCSKLQELGICHICKADTDATFVAQLGHGLYEAMCRTRLTKLRKLSFSHVDVYDCVVTYLVHTAGSHLQTLSLVHCSNITFKGLANTCLVPVGSSLSATLTSVTAAVSRFRSSSGSGSVSNENMIQTKLSFPRQDRHIKQDVDHTETKRSHMHTEEKKDVLNMPKSLTTVMNKADAKPTGAVILPLSQDCGAGMVKLTIHHCEEMDTGSLVFVINKWRGLRNISLVNVDFYMREIQEFVQECSRLTRLKFHFDSQIDAPILQHMFKHCLANVIVLDLDLHPMTETWCNDHIITSLPEITQEMNTQNCRVNSDRELIRLICWHLNAPHLRYFKLSLDKASKKELGPILVKNIQRKECTPGIAVDVCEWFKTFHPPNA